MNTLTLTMALLMGFTGSLHCAGMCGPIIWVMPFQFMTGFKKRLAIFIYHFSRVTTYALMALVLHSFRNLFHPQVQQIISIILGVLLLVMGVISFLPGSRFQVTLPWTGFVRRHMGDFMSRPALGTFFATGFLNGLLPCGLVYMALSASVTVASVGQAVALMYAFGIGTMPMLIAITVLRSRISLRFQHVRRLVPVMMFAFGSLFILRGMNLGIPYLSPQLAVTEHSVKACCCHHMK